MKTTHFIIWNCYPRDNKPGCMPLSLLGPAAHAQTVCSLRGYESRVRGVNIIRTPATTRFDATW